MQRGEVWVPFLAEFSNDQRLVEVVLLQERLGVVVAVNVDIGQGVVHGGILRASLNPNLQPGKDQFDPVNQFVNGVISRDRSRETLNGSFVAVHVQ